MNLQTLKDNWVDEPNYHKMIHETFIEHVNNHTLLKPHRDFVEQNAFGFGERSFHWFWKLLVDEMPKEFSFLEVGVFRGQALSVLSLIADFKLKNANIYGVSPMDSSDGHWQSDYFADVEKIHSQFGLLLTYVIYHGSSTCQSIIDEAKSTAPYDIVYIDGSHVFEDVTSDLKHYSTMVKVGGYLVVDDACNDLNMPFGFFQGIAPVTQAVLEWENPNFEFQFNVVHLRVYKRVS